MTPLWELRLVVATPEQKAMQLRNPPLPGGVARLMAGRRGQASGQALGSYVLEFALMVLFLSYMEAKEAYQYLTPGAEPSGGTFFGDLIVTVSDLVI